jgi:hypothetical protein
MASVFTALVTPAFVASVVSILWNIRAQKLAEHREYVTSFFQDARTAISNAVASAADYFTVVGAQRTAGSQTHLFICEREVRRTLAMVCETGPKLDPPMDIDRLQELADTLVDALTGDTFGLPECDASPGHAQSIATVGADLRDELVRVQQRQLEARVSADLFQRFLQFVRKPMGPLHYRD